jgi:pyruvate-formate lyase-activating enzyme
MKNYALFSVNGRFIGFTNFKSTTGLYKEMPESFDPVLNVYVGDYNTGELKHISELKAKDYREANVDQKWKVFETEMNTEAGRLIEQEFPLYKQLNTIMDVFYKNKEKLELTTEFLDMYNKIQDIRVNITASLESYKDAPKAEVISKEEERMFFEKYNQQHLNINDDPVDIQPVE